MVLVGEHKLGPVALAGEAEEALDGEDVAFGDTVAAFGDT